MPGVTDADLDERDRCGRSKSRRFVMEKVGADSGTKPRGSSLSRMDQLFLSTICAGILLLVTAFALATPSMRSDVPPEKTVLLRIAAR